MDSAVRPVVIVLLDPTSDRCSRFFQAPVLCRPDFLFFQAAMEPFDVAVALRVMIGRPPMGDAEPVERFDEPRRSELCPIVCGHRHVRFTAASASSVRQRCERFHPTISRVQQSITHTKYAQPTAGPAQAWSCPTARSDSARRLPRGPTLSSVVRADDASAPATRVRASLVALACDSRVDLLSSVATTPRADSRTPASLRTPRRSAHRRFGPHGCLVAV